LQNPLAAAGAKTTMQTYATILSAAFGNDSFLAPALRDAIWHDHTRNATIRRSPARDMVDEAWRYGYGCWVECPHRTWQATCDEARVYSSLGAFGTYPAVSRKSGEEYWIVVGQNAATGLFFFRFWF
jgi:hypothetical protein